MVLIHLLINTNFFPCRFFIKDPVKVQFCHFQCSRALPCFKYISPADHLINGSEPSSTINLSQVFCQKSKYIHHNESGLPENILLNSESCVATPTEQVFKWHFRSIMQPSTIKAARHLTTHIANGNIKATDFVEEDKISQILTVAKTLDTTLLNLIKEKLGDEFSYGDIKMAMAHMKSQELVEK